MLEFNHCFGPSEMLNYILTEIIILNGLDDKFNDCLSEVSLEKESN